MSLFTVVWCHESNDLYFIQSMSSVISYMELYGSEIDYCIVTVRDLTPKQREALRRVSSTYALPIRVIKFPRVAMLQKTARIWPSAVWAKIMVDSAFESPYFMVDCDTMCFGKFDDLSFMGDAYVVGLRGSFDRRKDTSAAHTIRLSHYRELTGRQDFMYLSAGHMMIRPGLLDAKAIYAAIMRYDQMELIQYPEQDILALLYQDYLGYFPDGYGKNLRPSDAVESDDVLNKKYKFVHIGYPKQWDARSPYYPLYTRYMNKCELLPLLEEV